MKRELSLNYVSRRERSLLQNLPIIFSFVGRGAISFWDNLPPTFKVSSLSLNFQTMMRMVDPYLWECSDVIAKNTQTSD
jgi:hypothetical protein